MLDKATTFLRYDNSVPLLLGIFFLGVGSVFAANEDVRTAVYAATETIVSVDNTYLANKDLASWTPRTVVVGVSEDSTSYYVSYNLETIGLKDSVWQDVILAKELVVSKQDLAGRDLGLYVSEQLNQVVDRELSVVRETQSIEKKLVTQKVVSTEYSGIVGKFIDNATETFPGYTPVVTEAQIPTETQTQTASAGQINADTATAAPALVVSGANPSEIQVGTSYSDLGVTVPTGETFSLSIEVNGQKAESVSIDTAAPGTHTISYHAVFSDGKTAHATRTVHVVAPTPVEQQQASGTEQINQESGQTTDSPSDVGTAPAGN